MNRIARSRVAVLLLLAMLGAWPVLAQTGQLPPPYDRTKPPGEPPPVPGYEDNREEKQPEVLGRGPLHEGYAQPSDAQPKPSLIVPKQPPEAIQEVPPEQKPEGDNVLWIPGYWSWDEDRADFIWISGFWRVPPPGRKWVPGYYTREETGWRWVSGFWADVEQPEVPYIPTPPPVTLDVGPNLPPPDDSYQWVTGIWMIRDDRWLWRPGYWCAPRPGWIYTPARYCWTPRGYLYVGGFWDRCLETRGVPFAPVYFSSAWYSRPGFFYRPTFALSVGGFLGSFWARPGWGCYAFGDYYGGAYARRGFHPWHTYGVRARDPLFGYYRNQNLRRNPGWTRSLATTYDGRVRGTLAAPPRRIAANARPLASTASIVQPLASYRNPSMGLTRVGTTERAASERIAATYRRIQTERATNEVRPVPRGQRPGALSLANVPTTIANRPRTLSTTPGTNPSRGRPVIRESARPTIPPTTLNPGTRNPSIPPRPGMTTPQPGRTRIPPGTPTPPPRRPTEIRPTTPTPRPGTPATPSRILPTPTERRPVSPNRVWPRSDEDENPGTLPPRINRSRTIPAPTTTPTPRVTTPNLPRNVPAPTLPRVTTPNLPRNVPAPTLPRVTTPNLPRSVPVPSPRYTPPAAPRFSPPSSPRMAPMPRSGPSRIQRSVPRPPQRPALPGRRR